jgi:hypothetical protein
LYRGFNMEDELEIYSKVYKGIKLKEELDVYSLGIVRCSICTNIKDTEKIEMLVNMRCPTGISSSWKISREPNFHTGQPNPCPCEEKPNTHKHYLMVC